MPNYTSAIIRKNWEKHGERPSVLDYGAKGDAKFETFIATVAGSSTITMNNPTLRFTSADIGKVIGIFGAGSSGRIVPVQTVGLVLAPLPTDWTVMNDYSGTVPVTLDTLGGISARFTVTCRFGNMEWAVFGSDALNFSTETEVYSSTVTIADGEVGGRDLLTLTTLTHQYYRIKARSISPLVTVHSFGCIAFYGYLHRTTIGAVTSDTTAEIVDATPVGLNLAQSYYGFDDTQAILGAMASLKSTVRGSELGGTMELPNGAYLVSDKIIIPNKIMLVGGGLSSVIVADTGVFPINSPVVQLGADTDPGAYSCRLEQAYVYCNETPGSIGVYSEKAQERSGVWDVDVQRFGKKGFWFKGFGCQHFTIDHCGAGPGGQTVGDDESVGIHLESVISANQVNRCTIFGNPSISAYGVGIKLSNGSACSLSDIHTESSYNGIEITGGSTTRIMTHTPGPGVIRGIVVSGDSSATIIDGGSSLVDEAYNRKFASALQGPITIGNETTRLIGKSGQGGDVWYAENNGYNVRINKLGRIEIDGANRRTPNIMVLGAAPNFVGPNQGGFNGINSQMSTVYPDWIQVSDKILCSAAASSDEFMVAGDWPTIGMSRSDYVGEHWTWTLADDLEVYVVGTDGASAGLPTELVFGTLLYVVNSDSSTKTFQLSLTLGGSAIDFTSDAAMIYITGNPYAGFYRMGATYFEFRSGNATNDQGADPGEMILQARADFGVRAKCFFFYRGSGSETNLTEQNWGNQFGTHRSRWSHGVTDQTHLTIDRSIDSAATWVNDAFMFLLDSGAFACEGPVFPSGQQTAGFYAYNGSPEGNLAAGKGSWCGDYANGQILYKSTGSGTTGWLQLTGAFTFVDANTVGIPYSIRLPNNRLVQWSSDGTANGTPDVGLSRSTFYSNEVEVNNGTAGSWAGLTASTLRAGSTLYLPFVAGDRMLKNGSGQTAEGMTASDVRTFADVYVKSYVDALEARIAALEGASVANHHHSGGTYADAVTAASIIGESGDIV